jgi:hypothetical protein
VAVINVIDKNRLLGSTSAVGFRPDPDLRAVAVTRDIVR